MHTQPSRLLPGESYLSHGEHFLGLVDPTATPRATLTRWRLGDLRLLRVVVAVPVGTTRVRQTVVSLVSIFSINTQELYYQCLSINYNRVCAY